MTQHIFDERSDAVRRMSVEEWLALPEDEPGELGIRYFWLVDPDSRTFEVYELGADSRYVRAFGTSEGALDEVPGCAGLVLNLDALWAEVERLDAADEPG